MNSARTIYRYTYVYRGEAGPVRDSKAFQTEPEARTHAAEFIARGYVVVVWRERQLRNGNRWQTDLDDPITQPLDP
jgi:hypothetical protein